MNISLTPELDQFVAERVESGLYASASEVIREGLRLLKGWEEMNRVRLQELKREIEIGVKQLEKGQGKRYKSAAALINHVKAEGRRRRSAAPGRKKPT
jgi:antitoxin ParD1/3/4